MATPRTIPWDMDPHTAAKHEILQIYLRQWFPKLMQATWSPGVIYLEGFAGPGVYKQGEDGSPIVALRTFLNFDRLISSGKPVHLVLNDSNPTCIDHLKTQVSAASEGSPANLHISYSTEPCSVALVAKAQARHRDAPVFAFLDSFGGPDISSDILRQVAARRSSEVLLTFGPAFLIRFGGIEQHARRGDQAFGDSSWQQILDDLPSKKRSSLVTSYLQTLRGAGFKHTLYFELLDEQSHPLFLLYGTSSTKGVEAMKTAMWKVDPITGIRYRDPRDPDQQALDLEWEPDLAPLRRLILGELSQGPRTIAQLRDFALLETIYRPPQVPDAVNQLRTNGQVTATPDHKRLTTKTVIKATGYETLF